MAIRIAVPVSVWGGWFHKGRGWSAGLFAHTLQGGQRWLFLLRIGKRAFGYRTKGDSASSHYAGWYLPWSPRFGSGRR